MDKLDRLTQLEAKITEARELLEDLESSARQIREKQQHEAVDQLEQYFEASELDFSKFGPFKDEIMEEWREFVTKIKNKLSL